MKQEFKWIYLLFIALLFTNAASAKYPEKTIKIIVPFTAGGATDIAGRLLAEELSKAFNNPVVVENREGAAGVIGVQATTKAAADGYTLLIAGNTLMTSHKTLYKNLPYDSLRDLETVSRISAGSHIIVVKANSNIKDMKDLLRLARAKPGGISYGSGGSGTSVHLAAEMFQVQAGVKLLHVPYRGTSLAVTGLMSGDTDLMFDTTPSAFPKIKSGQLRSFGITSSNRAPDLPDVPTVAEAMGLPDFELVGWFGLLAPSRTPPEVVARLHAETLKALKDPAVIEVIQAAGGSVGGGSSAQFEARIRRDAERLTEVIQLSGASAK